MKIQKFLYILVALVSVVSSCSDDNEEENTPMQITKSDVVYQASGGSGTIQVNSQSGIKSVTSSDDWCVATYSNGNTVSLDVAVNPSLEQRSAVISISANNGEEVRVSVSQTGSMYELEDNKVLGFGYDDATGTVNIASHNINADLVVSPSANWLSARQDGDAIIVHAAANTTGTWRGGVVYCQIGGQTRDSIVVVQAEEKDIYGDYYMVGDKYTEAQTYPTATKVSILPGDSANMVKFDWTDTGFSYNYEFNSNTKVIKLRGDVEHPLGYKRFRLENFMVGGNVDEMSGTYILFMYGNGTYSGGFGSGQNNVTCDVYLSAIGDQVVWRLRDNGSVPGVSHNGIFIYDDDENYYLNRGIYLRARNVYMIPADKYHSAK